MPKPMLPTNGHRLQAAERRAQALRLRIDGCSTGEIARRLGIRRETVWRALNAALAELKEEIAEKAEEWRAIQAARIEERIADLTPRAQAGEEAADRLLVRYFERQARLLNLDLRPDVPEGPQIYINTTPPWEREEPIEGEVAEVAQIEAGDDADGEEAGESDG